MTSRRAFGKRSVPLEQLSDEELLEEVQARRKRRGAGTPTPRGDETEDKAATLTRQVRQWLANLELKPNSSLEDVERAYDRLLRRYAPAAKDGDPQRRAAARALLASLKKAHQGLKVHFSRDW
ncbi:MAG: hypothetical protein OXU20_22825 [Myxococcales bacterium]|nr:hypothetical protein [Myxococcales bacterium]MDD9971525.1 hypothetical protein [Myxococcales bacterium]